MKLCQDCDHVSRFVDRDAMCMRPTPSTNVVTGSETVPLFRPCSAERKEKGWDVPPVFYSYRRGHKPCGQEAKFFEPRRSWWKRLLGIK